MIFINIMSLIAYIINHIKNEPIKKSEKQECLMIKKSKRIKNSIKITKS